MENNYNKTLLLSTFLGFFGVHRFYNKKYITGTLMLVTLGIFGIWWAIDNISILLGKFKDHENNYIKPIKSNTRNKIDFLSLLITGIYIVILIIKFTYNNNPTTIEEPRQDSFNNYEEIIVDACNLSGQREANVVVDIGYGRREYYAYTNENAQLVEVRANAIILQDKDEENSNGRYCRDEAKVEGTQNSNYDEGHVIADSLGGVANAYNITPQDSYVNRHGDQSEMEGLILSSLKDNKNVTQFVAIIEYDDDYTFTPNYYIYTFYIDGVKYNFEFNNSKD